MVTHDLGHFFASALIAGGASVKQVLGQASAVIALRIYAHLLPGGEKTAPGPPWTPCSAACGPGAGRVTLQPK